MKRCARQSASCCACCRELAYEHRRSDSLYKDLGVSEHAKEEEILAKFAAQKQASEVSKMAFEVLGDAKKRPFHNLI